MEQPGVVAGNLVWVFCSTFWAFLCISQAPVGRSLWSGHHWIDLLFLQKLSIDDANFGQKWWRQKWKKGQGSSRLVRAGMGINGLITSYSFIAKPHNHKRKKGKPMRLSWLAALYCLWVSTQNSDSRVAQNGGLTPTNRLKETFSLVYMSFFNHVMVNWHLSKQGICWPVSCNHILQAQV